MLSDAYAGITNTGWTVYNKPDTIYKAAGNITYAYNTANQRIIKTYGGVTTWYIRDAQGNVMGIYDNTHGNINWREQHLYGSSRLGMWLPNINLSTGDEIAKWDSAGYIQYELTNHLGNVMESISDSRQPFSEREFPTVHYFGAFVISGQDYYPFGMPMPNRQWTAAFGRVTDSSYRYGFNGKENDNEVMGLGNQQDYGERIYDTRVGRFLSVDPIAKNYPWLGPYSFAENDVIRSIDLDGLEKYIVTRTVDNDNQLVSISIGSFTDNEGNALDNQIYLHKPQLKKANVYIITENSSGKLQGNIQLSNSLTNNQEIIYKQFGITSTVKSHLTPQDESEHFDFREGKYGRIIGNDFNDGMERDASYDFNTKIRLIFQQNSDQPINDRQARKLASVARVLKLFPNAKITLIGNGGNDPNDKVSPVGNSSMVMNSPAILNGVSTTTRKLLGARAEAVKNILIRVYKIDPNRIQTTAGSVSSTPAGRNVETKITNINL